MHIEDFLSGADINISNSTNTQMKLSAVYRCIEVLSNSIGKIPWFITDTSIHKRADDRASKQLKYVLNVRTNVNMTPFIFFKNIEIHRLIYGNAYAQIKYDNTGKIERLELLDPNSVQIEKLEGGELVYIVTKKDKSQVKLQQSDILHIKGISTDGIQGQSVLSYAKQVTENAILQDEYTRQFYTKGGRPSAIVNIESNLAKVASKTGKADPSGKTAKELVREEWEKFNSGSSNAGRIAVTDKGETYTAIPQLSFKDMAFIEAKEISVADIARFFGVPLYKLFAGKESYQSNEANGIAYVTDTLAPILTQYEQELTYKCLLPVQKLNGYSVKGNLNAEMRGDLATRSKWYTEMRNNGAYSANDIRGFEDMEEVDGGDIRLVSKNYASLENFLESERAGINKALGQPTDAQGGNNDKQV